MLNVGALHEGFVLDHIKAGKAMTIYHDLKLDKLDCTVAIIKNAKSNKMGVKDIIKVECPIENLDLDILGFIDHNITVNIIKDEKIEELTDRVKRQMAEFENFRKRTEKEKAGMYAVGAKDVIEKILPVVDNFERGLDVAEDKEDPFVQGMEKIYKQFLTALDGMGVKAIEAVGNEFNPDFHNAVMHVEDETVGENIVVEEFQKGYMYKDSVVRHSMVKVAN